MRRGGVRRSPMGGTRTAHISTTAAARRLTSAATTPSFALIQAEGVNRVWRGQRFRYLDLDDGWSYWGWAGPVINRVRTDTV